MPKIVKNLTDKQIKSALHAHKNLEIKTLTKLSDGKGLYFVIDKKGCSFWRFDYVRPVSGKRNSISLGTYPEISLSEARDKHSEYRKLLSQNVDPVVEKDRKKEQAQFHMDNTFKLVAEEYRKTEELEPSTQKRNAFVWEKLYLSIGHIPLVKLPQHKF